ncbi:hypothetical protein LLG95_08160 [bacterium]|nr:hypothetical protein [bacterium]
MDMEDNSSGAEDVNAGIDEAGMKQDVEQLKADLARLRGDMSQLINSVVGLSRHGATTARERARTGIDQSIQQLQDTYSAMRQGTGRAADSLADTLGDRPLTSVAVAFFAGMLMGKMMR